MRLSIFSRMPQRQALPVPDQQLPRPAGTPHAARAGLTAWSQLPSGYATAALTASALARRPGMPRRHRSGRLFWCSLGLAAALWPCLAITAQARITDAGGQPGLHTESELQLEWSSRHNRQLRARQIRRSHELEPAIGLGLRWQGSGHWALVAKAELRHKLERETGKDREGSTQLKINLLYGELQLPGWHSVMRVGRWSVDDERNWLLDDELDGITLSHAFDRHVITAFAARPNYWGNDLLHYSKSRGDRSQLLGLHAGFSLGDKHHLLGRALIQHNPDTDIDLNHLSIGSFASPRDALQHWALLSHVRGKDRGRSVRGHAIDLGATWMFREHHTQPRLTLGYAWGSGDATPGEGPDRNHRQSGLHSNKARFGGRTSFRIYGETLNPSLSNLHVLTIGLGMAPGKDSSLDLVYHHYRQDRIGELAGTSLRPRADLQNGRQLGHGMDLVWGWRASPQLQLKAALGIFRPAERFRDSSRPNAAASKPAYSGWFEIKYRFRQAG